MAKTLTRRFKRGIGVISDLHAGSEAAPFPEGITTDQGRIINPTPKQQYLNQCLEDFGKRLDEFGCDVLFLLGDLVDGNNRRQWGMGKVTPSLTLQEDAAVRLLKPLTKGRKVVGVAGSGYHDSLDKYCDQAVIEKLNGRFLGLLANITIPGTKRTIQIVHGESRAVVYREQVGASEGAALLIAEAKNKLPCHIDMRISGHMHWFGHIHTERQHIVNVPGWVDWSGWRGGLSYYGRMIPDIGGCIIMIDTADRFWVLPFVYPRPMVFDGPASI